MALVLATTPRGRRALTKQHLLLLACTHVGSLITPIGSRQLIEPYPRSAGFFFMCIFYLIHMTTFTSYVEYRNAVANGQRNIRFVNNNVPAAPRNIVNHDSGMGAAAMQSGDY